MTDTILVNESDKCFGISLHIKSAPQSTQGVSNYLRLICGDINRIGDL